MYPRTDKGRSTVTPGVSIGTSIIACNNCEKQVCVFLQISKALVSGLLDIILFPFFPQGIQQQRTKEENSIFSCTQNSPSCASGVSLKGIYIGL